MDKKLIIVISIILLIAAFGFMIFSNITGNAITGSVIKQEVENNYFRMDIFENKLKEEDNSNATQNIS